MKRIITILCIALGLGMSFISCQREVPNIEFVNVVNHTADFSGIIAAIESQTTTLQQKLDLINTTLNDTKTTLDQKLELIKTAVDNGVSTYKELAQSLITAISNMQTSLEIKLQAVSDAITSNATTISGKLALFQAAVEAGFKLESDTIAALNTAIVNAMSASDTAITAKLELIEDAINAGFDPNNGVIAAFKTAVVNAMAASDLAIGDKLQAIHDILESNSLALGEKLDLLEAAIKAGFDPEIGTIVALKNAIVAAMTASDTAITNKLADIEAAIGLLVDAGYDDTNLINKLEELRLAILAGADYTDIIEAIKSLVPQPEPEPETDYVDLGLSVLWAKCNVGATSDTDYGMYFAWGETEEKAEYSITTYKWADSASNWTKYTGTDGLSILEAADDAATAVCGPEWRTPTIEECAEIVDDTKCDWTWTTKQDSEGNDINGYLITSKVAGFEGNSIFLPAAGVNLGTGVPFGSSGNFTLYWSSSLDPTAPRTIPYLYGSATQHICSGEARFRGMPVRPVQEKE